VVPLVDSLHFDYHDPMDPADPAALPTPRHLAPSSLTGLYLPWLKVSAAGTPVRAQLPVDT